MYQWLSAYAATFASDTSNATDLLLKYTTTNSSSGNMQTKRPCSLTHRTESCGSALTHIAPILPKQRTHIAGPTPLDNRFRNFRDEMSFSLGSHWGDYRFQPVTRLFSSVCSLCGDTWKTWFLKTNRKRGESDRSLEWLAPAFSSFPALADERLVAACNARKWHSTRGNLQPWAEQLCPPGTPGMIYCRRTATGRRKPGTKVKQAENTLPVLYK